MTKSSYAKKLGVTVRRSLFGLLLVAVCGMSWAFEDATVTSLMRAPVSTWDFGIFRIKSHLGSVDSVLFEERTYGLNATPLIRDDLGITISVFVRPVEIDNDRLDTVRAKALCKLAIEEIRLAFDYSGRLGQFIGFSNMLASRRDPKFKPYSRLSGFFDSQSLYGQDLPDGWRQALDAKATIDVSLDNGTDSSTAKKSPQLKCNGPLVSPEIFVLD